MSWSWPPIASLVARSAVQTPATRLYPAVRREPYARTRGHIELRIADCNFCTICAHRCPTRAIVVHKEEKVWAIDHTLCILCSICVDDCRESCIVLSATPTAPMERREVLTLRRDFVAPPPDAGVEVAPPATDPAQAI